MVARLNVLKFSCATFIPSLKFPILSQNARGGLHSSDTMYIAPVALKTSSLTICNSLSFVFFLLFFIFSQLGLPLACSLFH
jgi:hypothetical protein